MIDSAVLFVDAVSALVIAWVFQLVRREKLYVGYGVIFVLVISTGIAVLTVPVLIRPLLSLTALAERSSGLIGVSLFFMLLMLIYILSQLTLLARRVTTLTQELALQNARTPGPRDPSGSRQLAQADCVTGPTRPDPTGMTK